MLVKARHPNKISQHPLAPALPANNVRFIQTCGNAHRRRRGRCAVQFGSPTAGRCPRKPFIAILIDLGRTRAD